MDWDSDHPAAASAAYIQADPEAAHKYVDRYVPGHLTDLKEANDAEGKAAFEAKMKAAHERYKAEAAAARVVAVARGDSASTPTEKIENGFQGAWGMEATVDFQKKVLAQNPNAFKQSRTPDVPVAKDTQKNAAAAAPPADVERRQSARIAGNSKH
jgi:hypothetical protein